MKIINNNTATHVGKMVNIDATPEIADAEAISTPPVTGAEIPKESGSAVSLIVVEANATPNPVAPDVNPTTHETKFDTSEGNIATLIQNPIIGAINIPIVFCIAPSPGIHVDIIS